MDVITLNIIFEDEDGKKINVKFNDMRPDISSAEVLELGNKIVDDAILTNKGKKLINYLGAEKIIKEKLV